MEEISAGTSHFVLLGLTIPASDWKALDRDLDRVKSKYGLDGVEIHTGWMSRRYSEQESIVEFEKLDRDSRRAAIEEAIRKRSGILGVRGDRNKIVSYRREIRAINPYIHTFSFGSS